MLTPEEWTSLMLSLRVAMWSVAIMLPPGVAVAWLLARKQFVGRTVLDVIVHLPLVLPPVVVGYLLLIVLGRRSVVGRFLYENLGIEIAFTWRAAAIAAALMGFPLLVRSLRLGIELIDLRLEQAARTLGANQLRVFCTVTLPLSLPGLLVGIVLAFTRSLGEFGATITFAGNIEGVTRTLPTAIYTYTQIPGGDEPAMRLAVISVMLAVLAMIGSELIARRMKRKLGLAE